MGFTYSAHRTSASITTIQGLTGYLMHKPGISHNITKDQETYFRMNEVLK